MRDLFLKLKISGSKRCGEENRINVTSFSTARFLRGAGPRCISPLLTITKVYLLGEARAVVCDALNPPLISPGLYLCICNCVALKAPLIIDYNRVACSYVCTQMQLKMQCTLHKGLPFLSSLHRITRNQISHYYLQTHALEAEPALSSKGITDQMHLYSDSSDHSNINFDQDSRDRWSKDPCGKISETHRSPPSPMIQTDYVIFSCFISQSVIQTDFMWICVLTTIAMKYNLTTLCLMFYVLLSE